MNLKDLSGGRRERLFFSSAECAHLTGLAHHHLLCYHYPTFQRRAGAAMRIIFVKC